MDHRSILLNNAGTRQYLIGNYPAALDLYKVALEARLHFERGEDNNLSFERCVTPDIDEDQRRHIDDSVARSIAGIDLIPDNYDDISNDASVDPSSLQMRTNDNSEANASREQSGDDSFYLALKPFQLPLGSTNQEGQSSSAAIIFNIAILHHSQSTRSRKAGAFYSLASSLLSNLNYIDAVEVLRLSITNNLFVWTLINDPNNATTVELRHSVIQLTERDDMPPDIREGVSRNVGQYILFQHRQPQLSV